MSLRRLQYSVMTQETKNASGKAKNDCAKILEDCGYFQMYSPSPIRVFRLAQQLLHVLFIKRSSVLFIQYPANIDIFYRLLSYRNIRSVALLHDVEYLRNDVTAASEMSILQTFEGVIVHSEEMGNRLRDDGYEGEIAVLGLFDYLAPIDRVPKRNYDRFCVCFAGNLEKSSFIRKLNQIDYVTFNLYGVPEPTFEKSPSVFYKGFYSSEDIVFEIEGGWGLVWDGSSIEKCEGAVASYLRFNSPHKASMYIVAEIPIIVWSGSALASVVESKGIGICVKSLTSIPEVLSGISDEQYGVLLHNVRRMKSDLTNGLHLKRAVIDIENRLRL